MNSLSLPTDASSVGDCERSTTPINAHLFPRTTSHRDGVQRQVGVMGSRTMDSSPGATNPRTLAHQSTPETLQPLSNLYHKYIMYQLYSPSERLRFSQSSWLFSHDFNIKMCVVCLVVLFFQNELSTVTALNLNKHFERRLRSRLELESIVNLCENPKLHNPMPQFNNKYSQDTELANLKNNLLHSLGQVEELYNETCITLKQGAKLEKNDHLEPFNDSISFNELHAKIFQKLPRYLNYISLLTIDQFMLTKDGRLNRGKINYPELEKLETELKEDILKTLIHNANFEGSPLDCSELKKTLHKNIEQIKKEMSMGKFRNKTHSIKSHTRWTMNLQRVLRDYWIELKDFIEMILRYEQQRQRRSMNSDFSHVRHHEKVVQEPKVFIKQFLNRKHRHHTNTAQ